MDYTMSKAMKISATVIIRNEQDNIVRCLHSLAFAGELVAVDFQSSGGLSENEENNQYKAGNK